MYSTAHKDKKPRLMFDGFVEHGHFTRSVTARPAIDVFAGVDSSDVRLDFKNITPEKIKTYVDKIITMSNDVYQKIAALNNTKTPLTFANVILPEINLDIAVANMRALCTKAASLYSDERVRQASINAGNTISDFDTEIEMRQDIYQVFHRYFQYYYPEEKNSLSEQEAWRVEVIAATYRANHMNMPEQKRNQVREIKKKISQCESDYMRNLNEDETCFYLTREQLRGMPDEWFEDKKMNSKFQYKLTMKSPDIGPALTFVDDRALRKKLSIAYHSRAAHNNDNLFNEAIRLRHQLATKLGYSSYAEMEAGGYMAGTKKNILGFLKDLNQKITPLFEKEMQEVREIAKIRSGDKNFKLEAWDLRYYLKIYKNQCAGLDASVIKNIFPVDIVTQGLMKIYERLLGLKFFEIKTDNKVHDSVRYFEAYDHDTDAGKLGEMVGAFYLDLYPRQGKYTHAQVYPLIYGYQSANPDLIKDRRLPICTLVCNFPESGGLSMDDVETFFHEFGHVMHYICSGRVELQSLHAFSVEPDFIETPSLMLENWTLVPEVLKLISRDTETNEPIDDETIQVLIKSKKALKGYEIRHNLMLSLFDLNIHMPPIFSQDKIDANAVFRDYYQSFLGIDYPDEFHYPASFEHLMDGCEAGYFRYAWALLNATDMFYEKFKDDPLNPIAGRHYRKTILEPGSSKNSIDLLHDFLGRMPSNRHYLQSLGIGPVENGHNLRKRIGNW